MSDTKTKLPSLIKIIAVIMFLSITQTKAQSTNAYMISTGASQGYPAKVFNTGNGETVLAGYSRYGNNDSSYINLAKLNSSFVAVTHKELRLSNQLVTVAGVTSTVDGYVLGGINIGNVSTNPYILKTDTSFNINWAFYFDNLLHSQWGIGKIFNEANKIIAFSSNGNNSDGIYRIQSTTNDTTFVASVITPASGTYFRVEQGVPTGMPGEHIVCGEMADAIGQDAWLSKIDSAGVVWSYRYEFGGTVQELSYNLIKTSDGNLIVPSISQFGLNTIETFVSKIDTGGNMLWCKRIYTNGGFVYTTVTAETNQQEILLAGIDASYNPILVKLDAAGNLIWGRKWQSGGVGSIYQTPFIKKPDGSFIFSAVSNGFMFFELDAAGNGCNFVNDTAVHVVNFPVATVRASFPLTSAPFTPTKQTQLLNTVNQTLATTIVCTGVGVEETNTAPSISIYPQPAYDEVTIYLKENAGDRFVLKMVDITGRQIMVQAIVNSNSIKLNVSALPKGLYFVQLVSGEKNYAAKVMVE